MTPPTRSVKETVKDFVVIISSAASIIVGGFSLVGIASYIRMLSITYDSMSSFGGFSESTSKMLGGYWSCLIFCFVFTIIAAFNIVYIRRYLRDLPPKNYIGYTANIGAVIVSGFLIAGLIISSNIYNSGAMYIPVFVSTASGLFAFHFILVSIGIIAQIASTILMFKWEDPAAYKVIDITQTTPGAIMLSEAELKTKREAPPVLNADPNAPMQPAGHNIWDPSLVTPLQAETPASTQPVTPVQPVEMTPAQPTETTPAQPVETTMPMQPQPITPMPIAPMPQDSGFTQPTDYGAQAAMSATSQQTVASMQPGYGATGATFAQPGLEPTMNPYAQSGTYVQPDNGFMQTPPSVQ